MNKEPAANTLWTNKLTGVILGHFRKNDSYC